MGASFPPARLRQFVWLISAIFSSTGEPLPMPTPIETSAPLRLDLASLTPRGPVFPSPADWRDQTLYFLLPDRFSDANEAGRPRFDHNHPAQFAATDKAAWMAAGKVFTGGTLKGIRSKLDYLQNLGVTTLWIGPVWKQCASLETYHGYGIQNFLDIDPRFGSRQDLRDLIDDAHARGMFVLLDIIYNHAGNVFFYDQRGTPASSLDYRFSPPYPIHGWRSATGASIAAPLTPEDAIQPREFQDTNWAQYELIKLLCGKDRNVTVVGDDDQAIYKFRGASLANILQFRDDFPDAKTVALTQNYRSYKEILDTAYGFIKKNNPNRLEVKLAETGLSKKLEAARGEGGVVEVMWKRGIEDEAEAVAEEIKALKSRDPELTWNDLAILVRSNDSAQPFVHALDRAGVPFQFMALRGLYAKPAILDVIAILSLLDGLHESSSVWRVLHMGCYNLPVKDVAALTQYANRKGLSLWAALKQSADAHVSDDGLRIAMKLVAHVEGLAEAARRELPLRILQLALDKTEYLAWVMRLPEREKREYIQHLNGFAERVKRYEHSTHGPSLRGFLTELRIEIESGEEGGLDFDPDAGPELVKIMTVHASKGLEFKHVFVASLVDQRFPSRGRADAIPLPDGLVKERLPEGDAHLEEERRLFYVALTRAKDRLYLTGGLQYGGTRPKKPSPFFAEAGLEIPVVVSTAEDEVRRLQLRTLDDEQIGRADLVHYCLLYTSPSPRD